MAMVMLTPNGESVAAVEEAPADGKLYGRKDTAWEEVPAYVPEAPEDGSDYTRGNGEWHKLPDTTEAQRLTHDEVDAIQYAEDPSKSNPFLTLSQLPYLEKRLGNFELSEWPDGLSTLYSVCFGNGTFAAVGDNCAASSPDGQHWTLSEAANGYWRSVAYGGGVFAAVGLNGAAMYSEDPQALTWTESTAPEGDWAAVTYGNGCFVAVSDGKIMRSLNGKNRWSAKDVPAGYGEAITFGNGIFAAIGSKGVMTSPDGKEWTERDVPKATWRCGDYGDGRFITLAGKCAYSDDFGETWQVTELPSGGWDAVQYGDDFFVAVGNSAQCITADKDHLEFEQFTVPNFIWRDLAFGLDTFVVVGSGIMSAKVIDAAAAINNANNPNGTNVFATMLDLKNCREAVDSKIAQLQDTLNTQDAAIEAIKTAITELRESLIMREGE